MEQAEALQDDFVPEETQETEVEAVESQEEVEEVTDESEETEVTEESEFVEIERNGVKYSVPKELESEFIMQSDYTKKTQEVAEQRKALELQVQQFEQVVQAQRMNMQGHAQLAALQSQLEQYNNVNWNQFSQDDPQAAQQAFFQYQQLKDATANLSHQIQQQEAATLQQQREYHAKQLEQGKAELARDIPGWSQEYAAKLLGHGANYGFSNSELKNIVDPRMVKVLNDAYLYRQSLSKAKEQPVQKAKPVTKVKGKAVGAKDPNKMSTEEWLAWRNKQLSR